MQLMTQNIAWDAFPPPTTGYTARTVLRCWNQKRSSIYVKMARDRYALHSVVRNAVNIKGPSLLTVTFIASEKKGTQCRWNRQFCIEISSNGLTWPAAVIDSG